MTDQARSSVHTEKENNCSNTVILPTPQTTSGASCHRPASKLSLKRPADRTTSFTSSQTASTNIHDTLPPPAKKPHSNPRDTIPMETRSAERTLDKSHSGFTPPCSQLTATPSSNDRVATLPTSVAQSSSTPLPDNVLKKVRGNHYHMC